MKEEWLFPEAVVPVDAETTAALVAEIHRLIGVVGGMALAQRTWVGLTADELNMIGDRMRTWNSHSLADVYVAIEAKLKEKNT